MKKIVYCLLLLCVQNLIPAQYQLFNKDFEEWVEMPTSGGNVQYLKPYGDIWATSNEASMVFVSKPSVTRTTDAYNGTYAAKIETVQLGTSKGSGTIFTGVFKIDVINPLNSTKFGIPFTDKPISFRGFYKFIPVANDSFDIETYLTKWDNVNKRRDTIAAAVISREQSMVAVSDYTEFNLFYNYYSQETPDSLTIIMASSADGANFNAAVGTVLIVDAISLEYYPLSVENKIQKRNLKVFPNPVSQDLTIQSEKENLKDLRIYNSTGKLVLVRKIKSNNESVPMNGMSPGIYYYSIGKADGTIETGKFLKK
ncbi:MAG: PCMD domain-containing protein [Bacteroidales bacterium]